MGKKVKKVVRKLINPVATPVESYLLNSYDQPRQAEKAAKAQVTAINAASASQASHLTQQAQGAAYAQQAAINQANLATKLREQEQHNAQVPTTRLEVASATNPDPRRKYRGAGGASVGGTAGGMGIRLT